MEITNEIVAELKTYVLHIYYDSRRWAEATARDGNYERALSIVYDGMDNVKHCVDFAEFLCTRNNRPDIARAIAQEWSTYGAEFWDIIKNLAVKEKEA